MAEYGYAGEILKVDLSTRGTSKEATSDYPRVFWAAGVSPPNFTGTWSLPMLAPWTRELSDMLPQVRRPASLGSPAAAGRSAGKSPAHDPEAFSYANLGGKWGPALKSAGFDALAVQGKAAKPVYLYIHDGITEIRMLPLSGDSRLSTR